MKDLGEPRSFLGISIERNRSDHVIYIHQEGYIDGVLKRFRMVDCKPVATPMTTDKVENDNRCIDGFPYREAVGSIMYCMVASRPDLAASVGVLSRRLDQPTKSDHRLLKRVLRYFRGTKGLKLRLGNKADQLEFIGYVDSDWAGDTADRKSTTGFVFLLNDGTISWISRKQATIALSTTEAEYVAAASAAQEAIWIRKVLLDLGYEQKFPTTIFEDNQGCIKLANNTTSYTRVKHLDIKHHFLRDNIENGNLVLKYCPSELMIADLLTKALPAPRFGSFISKILFK